MNLEECRKRVQKIADISEDDEAAHGMEDELYADFVKHVAENGNKKLSAVAKEILKTENIDFARWYA